MSDLDTLYDRNEGFARTFDQGDLPILPRRSTIILTCADSRVDPAHFLGLELGDTLVLRNSGGRVTDNVEQDVALLSGMTRLVAGDRASASVRPRPPRARSLGASIRRQEWPGKPGGSSGAPQNTQTTNRRRLK